MYEKDGKTFFDGSAEGQSDTHSMCRLESLPVSLWVNISPPQAPVSFENFSIEMGNKASTDYAKLLYNRFGSKSIANCILTQAIKNKDGVITGYKWVGHGCGFCPNMGLSIDFKKKN